ncbi:unnamed protein product [Rotaria sordida]|uniref:Uncharacterized protein n=1 Tax=Rotaria sordida TaxID=392033 RepID=A0A819A8R5_9BILA|nr:unnamed protein product [Rotaria sordida]
MDKATLLSSDAVAVTWGNVVLGPVVRILPILISISALGGCNGSLFMSGRYCMVGARYGYLPEVFACIQKQRLTPLPAIVLELPSIQDNLWRGVTANLSDQYSSGSMHICHAASSCSDQVHVTDTFLDKKKHRTLFNIKCYNGQIIKNHSHYPDESETILPPGICIRVKSQSIPADNLYIISCEEIILTPEEMNNLLKTGAVATASAAMPITTSVLYLLWLDPNGNKSKENVAT